MRTTIRLDQHLLAEAKQLAARTHRTLTAVIEDALREVLTRARASTKRTIDLPTCGSGGLQPGVDLDDSARLLEVLEAEHDPA